MRNFVIIMVIAMFATISITRGIVLKHDQPTVVIETDPPAKLDVDKFLDTTRFFDISLADMTLFDQEGYDSLGQQPDVVPGAGAEIQAWWTSFHKWTHLTSHAIFLEVTGREYAYCVVPERH